MSTRLARRIISVGGGKGGVGKSIATANLAVAMAQTGAQVILVDADLGAANQHTLFGIDHPRATLASFLAHECEDLEAALAPTMVPNLRLLCGSGAVTGAANINHGQKQRLLRHIRGLDAEVVLVDIGAGVSFNTLDLYDVADLKVVVMTPQLPSLQNAYAFLKGAVYRSFRASADTEERLQILEGAARGAETEKLPSVIARVAGQDRAFADALDAVLDRFGARLLGNQVFSPAETNVFHSVSRMMKDFLGVSAPVVGALRATRAVHDSVSRRRPFLLDAHTEESARALRQVAEMLLSEDVDRLRRETPGGAREPAESPGAVPLRAAAMPH